MSYEILPEYVQDSPEWHQARRDSLGASEVAAVLGLSPWQTPLSVWRSKQSIPNDIDADAAWWGHAHEPTIAKWIQERHPEIGVVTDGMSIRSVDYPWLTATPDRTVTKDGITRVVELKTDDGFSRDSWVDNVPDYYRIQSLVQQGIHGDDYGWLAVLHGTKTAELIRIPFDPAAWEQIVRLTGEWWQTYVVGETAPEPSTIGEQSMLWPSTPGKTIELSETAFEVLERRNVLLADIRAQEAEADALQFQLGNYVEDAETLTYGGRKVATYKTQAGRRTASVATIEALHPELAPELITQGAPFKVLRTVKPKESKS